MARDPRLRRPQGAYCVNPQAFVCQPSLPATPHHGCSCSRARGERILVHSGIGAEIHLGLTPFLERRAQRRGAISPLGCWPVCAGKKKRREKEDKEKPIIHPGGEGEDCGGKHPSPSSRCPLATDSQSSPAAVNFRSGNSHPFCYRGGARRNSASWLPTSPMNEPPASVHPAARARIAASTFEGLIPLVDQQFPVHDRRTRLPGGPVYVPPGHVGHLIDGGPTASGRGGHGGHSSPCHGLRGRKMSPVPAHGNRTDCTSDKSARPPACGKGSVRRAGRENKEGPTCGRSAATVYPADLPDVVKIHSGTPSQHCSRGSFIVPCSEPDRSRTGRPAEPCPGRRAGRFPWGGCSVHTSSRFKSNPIVFKMAISRPFLSLTPTPHLPRLSPSFPSPHLLPHTPSPSTQLLPLPTSLLSSQTPSSVLSSLSPTLPPFTSPPLLYLPLSTHTILPLSHHSPPPSSSSSPRLLPCRLSPFPLRPSLPPT